MLEMYVVDLCENRSITSKEKEFIYSNVSDIINKSYFLGEIGDRSIFDNKYRIVYNAFVEDLQNEFEFITSTNKRYFIFGEIDIAYSFNEFMNLSDDEKNELINKSYFITVPTFDETRPAVLFVDKLSFDETLDIINKASTILKSPNYSLIEKTDIINLLGSKLNNECIFIINNNIIGLNCKRESILSDSSFKIRKITLNKNKEN